MPHPDRPAEWADLALHRADLVADPNVEITLGLVATYVRAAYAIGYGHAHSDMEPLTEQQARVAYARLRLDLPD